MDPSSSHPGITYEIHQFAARGERWKRIRSLTSKAISNENLRKVSDSSLIFIINIEQLFFERINA